MYLLAISISFSVNSSFMTFVHFSIKFELTLRGHVRGRWRRKRVQGREWAIAEMRGECKAFKKLPVVKRNERVRAAELMLNKYWMKGWKSRRGKTEETGKRGRGQIVQGLSIMEVFGLFPEGHGAVTGLGTGQRHQIGGFERSLQLWVLNWL